MTDIIEFLTIVHWPGALVTTVAIGFFAWAVGGAMDDAIKRLLATTAQAWNLPAPVAGF